MNTITIDTWHSPKILAASRTLKAIAHPVRLSIIEMLEDGRRMTVTEIYTTLNADQSFVSHHLSILRGRGVVATSRRGKHIYYYLKDPAYIQLLDCLNVLQTEVLS